MPNAFCHRIKRSRTATFVAITAVLTFALSAGVAQAVESPDTVAKVTGGGTGLAAPTYATTIASFGLNARRPVGFVGGGTAEGRISYNRRRNSTGRHFNVPVVPMQAFVTSTASSSRVASTESALAREAIRPTVTSTSSTPESASSVYARSSASTRGSPARPPSGAR